LVSFLLKSYKRLVPLILLFNTVRTKSKSQ
jgi:hypothetical protein